MVSRRLGLLAAPFVRRSEEVWGAGLSWRRPSGGKWLNV